MTRGALLRFLTNGGPMDGYYTWMLVSASFVLLMTPGLALFYGGMVRAKSVLNMMMMSFGAHALISVLWVIYACAPKLIIIMFRTLTRADQRPVGDLRILDRLW